MRCRKTILLIVTGMILSQANYACSAEPTPEKTLWPRLGLNESQRNYRGTLTGWKIYARDQARLAQEKAAQAEKNGPAPQPAADRQGISKYAQRSHVSSRRRFVPASSQQSSSQGKHESRSRLATSSKPLENPLRAAQRMQANGRLASAEQGRSNPHRQVAAWDSVPIQTLPYELSSEGIHDPRKMLKAPDRSDPDNASADESRKSPAVVPDEQQVLVPVERGAALLPNRGIVSKIDPHTLLAEVRYPASVQYPHNAKARVCRKLPNGLSKSYRTVVISSSHGKAQLAMVGVYSIFVLKPGDVVLFEGPEMTEVLSKPVLLKRDSVASRSGHPSRGKIPQTERAGYESVDSLSLQGRARPQVAGSRANGDAGF